MNQDSRGCLYMAMMYEQGENIKQSSQTALQYYQLACEQGNQKSCWKVALAYEEGINLKQDLSKAIQYYSQLCATEEISYCPKAQTQLQHLCEQKHQEVPWTCR